MWQKRPGQKRVWPALTVPEWRRRAADLVKARAHGPQNKRVLRALAAALRQPDGVLRGWRWRKVCEKAAGCFVAMPGERCAWGLTMEGRELALLLE